MKVAALQMNSGEVVDENLTVADGLIGQAVESGAEFVVLPENFSLMTGNHEVRLAAAQRGLEAQRFLSELAKKHSISLVGGSIPLASTEGKVTNSCLMYGAGGEFLARYDKIHLFDVDVGGGESYQESARTDAGSQPVLVSVPNTQVGLTICYDMRFPELFRTLSERGAEVFTVPSAFTVPTGQAHWHVLLRCRAIENLAWIIAPAQVGCHPGGRETFGHSLIIDPWGEVVAEQTEPTPQVVLADIDLQSVRDKRRRFPVLTHRHRQSRVVNRAVRVTRLVVRWLRDTLNKQIDVSFSSVFEVGRSPADVDVIDKIFSLHVK